MTSAMNRNRLYNVNTRLVYGMRSIGKGRHAAQTFCAIMNLPPPPARFDREVFFINESLSEIAEASMRKAAMETVELNGNNRDICGAFDGSYSGGMEVQGAVNIFRQSEDSLNIRYVQYLGDGDSKGFKKVQEDKPYGEGVEIEKLECIGHVHKRMGARLGRLKKELKGIKLDDGKTLAGAGRLTNTEIDLFQTYYGLAIRKNTGNVEEMRKSVWATYFHKISTNEKPYHQLCPKGLDSWCGYNKAQAQNKVYDHRHSLPEAVMLKVKPIFRDLADKKLLEKCTHGCTQNPNESFNNCIWERLPKTVFVGLNVLKTGVLDAVITFNDGSSSRKKVLELMGIKPGLNMERALCAIDVRRVKEAEKAMQTQSKEHRTAKRNQKRRREEEEKEKEDDYNPGMH
ncbi:hypothetical protein ANN_16621 [Periplaneta americana]|uniref:Mutator-like transposase domain-containing protein n=1 Tax=Periplaneta americana TaxID=6978 RepID=A0ABQ8SQV9_PERAM|nr:hypothetical protein ANN_16621 [Periplaneta americana]